MKEWMDGWKNLSGWIDGCLKEWMDGWLVEWMNEDTNRQAANDKQWKNEWMSE